MVPNEELERAARGEPAAAEGPASGAITLQVGSFRDPRDAEALKARIALLGEVARVVPVVIDGSAWYRVRLGPFPDPRALEDVRRRLAEHGIEGIALRESAR
ncbi:MAG: SPOR domain-containing protein [Xanthomonadales bacterium]|nr:SPOR domain-containing protein [Xanthomonadales bacterium]